MRFLMGSKPVRFHPRETASTARHGIDGAAAQGGLAADQAGRGKLLPRVPAVPAVVPVPAGVQRVRNAGPAGLAAHDGVEHGRAGRQARILDHGRRDAA